MALPLSLPVPLARPLSGVSDALDPVARSRAERWAELIGELLPAMRRRAPHLEEPALLEAVERIAAHRLADEELAEHSW